MNKLIAGLGAGVLILSLSGCAGTISTVNGGDEPSDYDSADKSVEEYYLGSDLYEITVTLSDGRELTCIKFEGYQEGGLDCYWDGAYGNE